MTTLAQGPDGDLALTDGRLTKLSGPYEKAQKILNRLRLFKGEWFLDTRVGVPYFSVVLIKNPDLDIVKRLFRRVVLSVPGIVEMPDIQITWDTKARTLAYTFRAIDDEGNVIEGGPGDPFIVKVET